MFVSTNMILKLVFENTIKFCAYVAISFCIYNCKFFSIDLIIATYNVAGLGNDIKRKRACGNFLGQINLIRFFSKKHTHLLTNYGKRHESKIIWGYGTTNSKNVAIAFKRNLKIAVVNIFPDKNGTVDMYLLK